jgi:hypothetical protein
MCLRSRTLLVVLQYVFLLTLQAEAMQFPVRLVNHGLAFSFDTATLMLIFCPNGRAS